MNIDFLKKFTYKFPNSIEEIDTFSGKDFERFLFEYFKLEGCIVTLTDDSGDRGVDLTVVINSDTEKLKIGIQAKRWKQPIGQKEISAILSGKKFYTCDELWIITTSSLTAQAQTEALNNDIKILTREDVIYILNKIKENEKANFKEQNTQHLNSTQNAETKNIVEEKLHIFVNAQNPNSISSKNNDQNLFTILSDLRKELAKQNNLYRVFLVYNNETINSIIEIMPKTLDDLRMVKGLGDKKIELYGTQILQKLNDYIDNK